jgi:hypothetical protein
MTAALAPIPGGEIPQPCQMWSLLETFDIPKLHFENLKEAIRGAAWCRYQLSGLILELIM